MLQFSSSLEIYIVTDNSSLKKKVLFESLVLTSRLVASFSMRPESKPISLWISKQILVSPLLIGAQKFSRLKNSLEYD